MGTKGFSGIQTISYHLHEPTAIKKITPYKDLSLVYEDYSPTRPRYFQTDEMTPQEENDPILGRNFVLGNEDVKIGVVSPTKEMDYFYKNSDGDEVLFVHEGQGELQSTLGTLPFKEGDYIVIPVGITYRLNITSETSRFLVIETFGEIKTPARYRNEFGQLNEHSPFCERDIHPPVKLETFDEKGEFEIRVKFQEKLNSYIYEYHPFDVVGWDGYLYPYTFSIHDFEPITGRVNQPPPIHQTFEGNDFVICSFVPRLNEYHPLAIPAPYIHSNVDSDEVLYYVDGNFISRKGVDVGGITLHPMSIPHGPHPGAREASIGTKEVKELAVMVDTLKPLQTTRKAHECENNEYAYSWIEK